MEFQLNQVPRHAHSVDGGPSKQRSQRNPTVAENAFALKLANIDAIACEVLDRQSLASLVSRHGVAPNVPSRNA
jgi:hypothetical protein